MSFSIDVYKDIPQSEIEAKRLTSEGKEYTLNHPQELVVNMRYKGDGSSSANSQGWERNSTYYFKELLNNHPEYFSKKNTFRIQNGESPKVDARFIQAFPQYEGFENETLIHHHVGKDGQAVAVPQSIHKGFGEIHNYEKDLGIVSNAEKFSDLCRNICVDNPDMLNQTSDQFKASLETMDLDESVVKSDADEHEDSDTGKQEVLEAREEKVVNEQGQVDSQQKIAVNDYLLQKQLREKRHSGNSDYQYQYGVEDPEPKGLFGRIKSACKKFKRKHPEAASFLQGCGEGVMNYAWEHPETVIRVGVNTGRKIKNKIYMHSSKNSNRNAYIPQSGERKTMERSKNNVLERSGVENADCDNPKIIGSSIRRLPKGWKASQEKKDTAGKNGNPVIQEGQTWVKEHPSRKKKE